MNEVFFEIHRDLPREGPGDTESTARAFSMLTGLPPRPAILDIGCGPGMQTLDLLDLTEGSVVAVDNHQPFLDQLLASASRKKITDRLRVVNADMADLDFEEHSFDLIWAEGSAFIIGFENALRTWRPLLREPGFLAASDLTWTRSDPPDAPRRFFAEAYPPMQDIASNLDAVRRAGYQPIGHFTLPEDAWWRHYYHPMEERLAELRERYAEDPEALASIDLEEKEIALYREYSDCYGYVFYLMRTD